MKTGFGNTLSPVFVPTYALIGQVTGGTGGGSWGGPPSGEVRGRDLEHKPREMDAKHAKGLVRTGFHSLRAPNSCWLGLSS